MLPGMPDFSQILMQAQQMQAEMERAQASLAERELTGTSGGGLVTAVLNGGGDLLRLAIDPSVVDPTDVETLEDLIVAAVHDARRAAQTLANDTMGGVASGLTGALDLSALGLSLPNFGPADEEDEYLDDEYGDQFEDDEDDGATDGDRGDGGELEVITVGIDRDADGDVTEVEIEVIDVDTVADPVDDAQDLPPAVGPGA